MGGAIVFVVALGVVAGLGYGAGEWFSVQKAESDRSEITASVVERMGTINVGDTLPDHVFEDLSRNSVRLSNLISGKTLITFVSPKCPACTEQVVSFTAAVESESQRENFIFISPHNPRFLEDIRNTHHLTVPILYDHNREYWDALNISAFPLNVTVGADRVITDILAGGLAEQDFREFCEWILVE